MCRKRPKGCSHGTLSFPYETLWFEHQKVERHTECETRILRQMGSLGSFGSGVQGPYAVETWCSAPSWTSPLCSEAAPRHDFTPLSRQHTGDSYFWTKSLEKKKKKERTPEENQPRNPSHTYILRPHSSHIFVTHSSTRDGAIPGHTTTPSPSPSLGLRTADSSGRWHKWSLFCVTICGCQMGPDGGEWCEAAWRLRWMCFLSWKSAQRVEDVGREVEHHPPKRTSI